MSRDSMDKLEKAIEDSREKFRIKIRGPINLDDPNVVKFSKSTGNFGGIFMVFDLLEMVFGIKCDRDKPELHYKGEIGDKVRISYLRNFLIEILEKSGLTIKICGNCGKYQKDLSSGDYDGRCVLDNSIRRFGWPCRDVQSEDSEKWIPKEKK